MCTKIAIKKDILERDLLFLYKICPNHKHAVYRLYDLSITSKRKPVDGNVLDAWRVFIDLFNVIFLHNKIGKHFEFISKPTVDKMLSLYMYLQEEKPESELQKLVMSLSDFRTIDKEKMRFEIYFISHMIFAYDINSTWKIRVERENRYWQDDDVIPYLKALAYCLSQWLFDKEDIIHELGIQLLRFKIDKIPWEIVKYSKTIEPSQAIRIFFLIFQEKIIHSIDSRYRLSLLLGLLDTIKNLVPFGLIGFQKLYDFIPKNLQKITPLSLSDLDRTFIEKITDSFFNSIDLSESLENRIRSQASQWMPATLKYNANLWKKTFFEGKNPLFYSINYIAIKWSLLILEEAVEDLADLKEKDFKNVFEILSGLHQDNIRGLDWFLKEIKNTTTPTLGVIKTILSPFAVTYVHGKTQIVDKIKSELAREYKNRLISDPIDIDDVYKFGNENVNEQLKKMFDAKKIFIGFVSSWKKLASSVKNSKTLFPNMEYYIFIVEEKGIIPIPLQLTVLYTYVIHVINEKEFIQIDIFNGSNNRGAEIKTKTVDIILQNLELKKTPQQIKITLTKHDDIFESPDKDYYFLKSIWWAECRIKEISVEGIKNFKKLFTDIQSYVLVEYYNHIKNNK